MTNEIIEFYREHLKPIIQKMLLETNYQGQGEVDYEEFGRDFDELLDLAIIGMQSNSDEDMTVEKYRTRLMEVFHNADCSELISFVCLPTEEEFENLEYLLKNHYKNKSNSYEDCISRQATIEAIEDDHRDKRYSCFASDYDAQCFKDIIRSLPSVTPKPKTGHWIDHQEGRWIYAKCSECGTVHDTQTNYCPNCGAKMESEDKE